MDIRRIREIGKKPLHPRGPVPVDPTPDEIAEACREIQETWSEAERARRSGMRKSDGDVWFLPWTNVEPGTSEPAE